MWIVWWILILIFNVMNTRPFVEYIGVIPPDQLLIKQKELEEETRSLISIGGKVFIKIFFWCTFASSFGLCSYFQHLWKNMQVSASVLPYDEAAKWCNGDLPSYILKVRNEEISIVFILVLKFFGIEISYLLEQSFIYVSREQIYVSTGSNYWYLSYNGLWMFWLSFCSGVVSLLTLLDWYSLICLVKHHA